MGRSSRILLFFSALLLAPAAARAQFYGFPSEVGVIDDGFGVLPPLPPPPLLPDAGFSPPQGPADLAPSPRRCALIIQIGRGIKRATSTRVVYGRAPCR